MQQQEIKRPSFAQKGHLDFEASTSKLYDLQKMR